MALAKGTATDYLDLVDQLDAFIVGDHVATVAIVSGGSSFAVDDIITLTDGTFDTAARFIVTSVSAGVITGIRIYDSGSYSADPDLTATTSWSTSGSGTGATFDLTMESDPWTIELASTIETTEEVRIYSGTGGGGVFVGFRTYQEDTGARQARNWALFGLSSYNGALPWYQQPDFPSGYGINTSTGAMTGTAQPGCYMVMKDNDSFPMDYWFHVTNRRIIVVVSCVDGTVTTPRYFGCYMGLLNPLGTSDEFPYPLVCLGSANTSRAAWDDLAPNFHLSSMIHLTGIQLTNGPGMYFGVDGAWKSVQNNTITFGGSTRTEANLYTVYPTGQPNIAARNDGHEDIAVDNPTTGFQWETVIQMAGSIATAPPLEFWPTPDSGTGTKRLLVPCVLTISNSGIAADYQLVGELDGVYWVSAAGSTTVTSEDELDDSTNSEHFRAFQGGTYSGLDSLFAVRED